MESLEVNGISAHSFGIMVVGVISSITEDDMAGMGYFVREIFEKRVVTGYYSCMLMYMNTRTLSLDTGKV